MASRQPWQPTKAERLASFCFLFLFFPAHTGEEKEKR
jgi:hypothetical protein